MDVDPIGSPNSMDLNSILALQHDYRVLLSYFDLKQLVMISLPMPGVMRCAV